MQLRMVAAGLGLGLVPEGVLQRSGSYRELSVVSIPGFKLNMDIWLVHPLQLGNLRRAAEVLARTVTEGFADYASTPGTKRRVRAR
jgi:DNA-binding transcriptional LysR family regulator